MVIIVLHLVFLVSIVAGKPSLSEIQRSKEANCLIQGYHTCLLSHLSPTRVVVKSTSGIAAGSSTAGPTTVTPFAARVNSSANAADCFRLSRAASGAAGNRSSAIVCKEDECPWDGTCLKRSSNNENDGFHTVEDLPISTYYENVHTIAVSFPKYLDTTVLYVLETRPITIADGSSSEPSAFRFAGVSNQTTITYRVFDICQRYEFRPTAILSNGSVITFEPKTTNSNPPDFIVENIRMVSLKYATERRQIVANLTWKHPYGYTNMEVDRYESYLHTLQCDAPSESLNDASTDPIIKTEEGGTVTAVFPEIMVERKCQFRFMVWATNACGNRTLTDAKLDITLNCSTVEGFKCPAAEMRPVCLSHVDIVATLSSDHAESNNISANISWTPTAHARPQYYHVRWGPARALDLRHKMNSGGEDSREEEADEDRKGHSSRRAKSLPNSGSTSSDDELARRQPRDSPDFSVWVLQPDSVTQEKVPGDTPFVVLSNLSSDASYGIQVCSIFNGDFKKPEWPKVMTSGFACSDSATVVVECSKKSVFDHPSSSTTPSASLVTTTTALPTIRPPLASILGVSQPPENIETISDFTQTLVNTEPEGIHMRLSWKPPKNVLVEQIANYAITVESLLPCEQAPACCDYVEDTDISRERDNATGSAALFLPRRVLHSHCEFVAKITTTAINGASSVSLKNIRVPPVPPSLRVHELSSSEQTNSSCQHLQCSHTCNSTHCLCPSELVLGGDGRTCVSTDDLMPNDSPAAGVDCIIRFGCAYDLCDTNGCICPEGYNLSLNGLECAGETPSGPRTLEGEPVSAMFDYCQSLGCKFTCSANGLCVCPSNMKLSEDGKSCNYEDPDVWNSTAPPPSAELKPASPSILCASTRRQLFSWTKLANDGIQLVWNLSSIVFAPFDHDSQVRVRIGTASRAEDGIMLYRLDERAEIESTSLISESISLHSAPTSSLASGLLGVQFCIYNSRYSINGSSMNWDIVPIVLLTNDDEEDSSVVDESSSNQLDNLPTIGLGKKQFFNHSRPNLDNDRNQSRPPSVSISSKDTIDTSLKKTIAMAVVIPVSILIILASLLALLCYFRPEAIGSLRNCCRSNHDGPATLRRRREGGGDDGEGSTRVRDIPPRLNFKGRPSS